jgi:hypothetical protein
MHSPNTGTKFNQNPLTILYELKHAEGHDLPIMRPFYVLCAKNVNSNDSVVQ